MQLIYVDEQSTSISLLIMSSKERWLYRGAILLFGDCHIYECRVQTCMHYTHTQHTQHTASHSTHTDSHSLIRFVRVPMNGARSAVFHINIDARCSCCQYRRFVRISFVFNHLPTSESRFRLVCSLKLHALHAKTT